MDKFVIVACDFQNRQETFRFLDQFQGESLYVKIGMELYYGNGPEIVTGIKKRGHKVFLDLKLHDIPNTVYRAMSMLAELDVDMVNLHASGGKEMIKAARKALDEHHSKAILLAVTQLTSIDQNILEQELLIHESLPRVVQHYALIAKEAGCDGVVCSALEVEAVKASCGSDFITVTPGIRFSDCANEDQKRVATPRKAREIGSDFIVMGRPITKAENVKSAYERAKKEFEGK